MPHKYQATIDLMKTVIHKLPCVFPADRHQDMEDAIARLERDPQAKLADIENRLIEFGLELWPYCEAHDAFHKIYGSKKEKDLIRNNLSAASRKELDAFIEGGGDIESMRDAEKFEHFFSPEIHAELVDSEMKAHDQVHEEMEKLLSTERRADFDALLKSYQDKMAATMAKIKELESLAARSPQWSAEIMDKVKVFKEGFAYVERPATIDDVAREIQYYVDIME